MPNDVLPVEQIAGPLQQMLNEGKEVVLTVGGKPAWICKRLNGEGDEIVPPGFGAGKGLLVVISEDDEHLADFAEYML